MRLLKVDAIIVLNILLKEKKHFQNNFHFQACYLTTVLEEIYIIKHFNLNYILQLQQFTFISSIHYMNL